MCMYVLLAVVLGAKMGVASRVRTPRSLLREVDKERVSNMTQLSHGVEPRPTPPPAPPAVVSRCYPKCADLSTREVASAQWHSKCERRCRQCYAQAEQINSYFRYQLSFAATRFWAVWSNPKMQKDETSKKVGALSAAILRQVGKMTRYSHSAFTVVSTADNLSAAVEKYEEIANTMNDFSYTSDNRGLNLGLGAAFESLIGEATNIEKMLTQRMFTKVIDDELGHITYMPAIDPHRESQAEVVPISTGKVAQDFGFLRKCYTDMASQYKELEKYCSSNEEERLPGDLDPKDVKRLNAAVKQIFDAAFTTSR